MYHYRADRFADYIITYLCALDYVKEQFIRATWHPFAGIIALTCLFFLLGVILALLMKFLALFVKRKSPGFIYILLLFGVRLPLFS